MEPTGRQPITVKPWERLSTETTAAYEAFAIYRDLGYSRSQEKVYTALRKNRNLIERWSTTHHWVERCLLYDRDVERKRFKAGEEAIREMSIRHAQIATQALQKASERLVSLDPSKLSPAMLIKFMTEAADLERRARGVPDIKENRITGKNGDVFTVNQTTSLDLTGLSDEEVSILESLTRKVVSGPEPTGSVEDRES